jgi:tetratricopeptide (TPR) repeat protein
VLRCPKCGRPLASERCDRCANRVVFRIVQREIALLILLSAITIPLFVFTRSVAARNRARNIEIGNVWYQRGQEQLRAGSTQQAIDSFRNATTNDHDNSKYTLALATALAAEDHIEEARQALLRLRASAPESGEVNLDLARLDAKEDKMPEAVRYYHNALYGVWPPDQTASQRTKVRTELVRVLLTAGDNSQALSELLILSSDTPDNGPAHDNVGQLFLEAGDSQHALEQFTRALRLNGKDADALAGAGRASFDLGDYTKARRYLEAGVANGTRSPDVPRLLETDKLVLSRDPLGPRLGTEERVRRLNDDLNFVLDELQSCVIQKQGDENSLVVLQPLLVELTEGLENQFQPKALRGDAEGFRNGLNLIQRSETATTQICGESSALHNALLLIGKKRGVTEQ